jgi:hypothetical protein
MLLTSVTDGVMVIFVFVVGYNGVRLCDMYGGER